MCKIIDRWKEPQSLLIGWVQHAVTFCQWHLSGWINIFPYHSTKTISFGTFKSFFVLETSVNQVSHPIVLDYMKCNSVKVDISDCILKWLMHHFSSHSFSCIFRAQVDIRKLKRNAVIVAESLARFVYNLSDKVRQTFGGSRQI